MRWAIKFYFTNHHFRSLTFQICGFALNSRHFWKTCREKFIFFFSLEWKLSDNDNKRVPFSRATLNVEYVYVCFLGYSSKSCHEFQSAVTRLTHGCTEDGVYFECTKVYSVRRLFKVTFSFYLTDFPRRFHFTGRQVQISFLFQIGPWFPWIPPSVHWRFAWNLNKLPKINSGSAIIFQNECVFRISLCVSAFSKVD